MNTSHDQSLQRGAADDQRRVVSSCPLCTGEYASDGIQVLKDECDAQLLHLTCATCKGAMLALVVETHIGLSSIGMLTDLTQSDASRMCDKEPLTEDDVLAVHDVLAHITPDIL
jgi:hypothetical protein